MFRLLNIPTNRPYVKENGKAILQPAIQGFISYSQYILFVKHKTQAKYVKRNTQALARNYCCRAKAMSIIYLCARARACVSGRVGMCVRVCSLAYPACNAYAPYCDVICGLCLHDIFRHYLINGTIFGKTLLNIKCVFWFSLQLLSKTFLILRRI